MTIEQSDLDAIAHAFDRANGHAIRAGIAAHRGDLAGAEAHAAECQQFMTRGYKAALRAGATPPAPMQNARELPLSLLDTPANRRLLSCLLATYEAARLVDIERGEDPADGFSAIIESLAADRRDEIGGPVGAGRE